MVKANFLYNIFNRGWSSKPVLTPVFLFYREFLSESSTIDYIELKPKSEGLSLIKSTIQIPLLFSYPVHAMLSTATCDLTQLLSNAVKLNNRSIVDTFETNVKGLIELMYQF